MPPAPAAPDLAAVMAQLEQLRALLSGGKPSLSGAIDPRSGSIGSDSGATVHAISMNLLVEPTGIEPVTCALRMQGGPAPTSHVLVSTEPGVVNTEPGVPESSPAEPRLTQSAGQSNGARSAPLASVHKLSEARKRKP